MALFNKKEEEEIQKLKGENNQLKFEVKRLERSIDDLKARIKETEPLINALNKRIGEQQTFIDKYTLDVTSSPEKFAEHKAKEKGYSKGKPKTKGGKSFE